ncbi:undecaprenyl-phosphate glucose phosphotransferase [Pseudomonas sp. SWI6]|uniref:Undecaprenyl-phosphate glucose phosphotransferase n=1 Tax=Pseudomonas taiwanensis TaxID=470150 RepID=A0ABR6VDI4_9PSED|nr:MULTISPECIES: undecaprenyl-phosphate glucose phosphotransferase [Pseudomonas]AGZ35211.1 sugar transferase [Pseudomonas sp. VLB120]AVD83317.1 undecaprenyl-phosphate glucose phosphotransferase [Pseudomonas sp. SWI6]MBC3478551.1 undecaprenyl-phosphate glucose phosphotransferase [Pseudomonas taiwanensis]MBC3493440.1 undecaprenyl-phosphate glucose phosphotransferase [Pseudomonas taiwanensis]MDT8921565.1 undecaprenyl-phosphate glucose phosphotransferase [Pseudomonas taiwanensis]
MVFEPRSSRSLLQRRSSVSNAIQAGLDGIAVTGIAWYLIYTQFGYITSDYVIMLLLLIGALAVVYDHYAIYRSNAKLSIKAFRLFKAWSVTFCFLVVMAFLTKQSETYSRLLVGKLFVIGYFAQLFLHIAVREVQKRFMTHGLDNALIIGTGELANFLHQKISNNPWLGERVVGCVLMEAGQDNGKDGVDGKQRLPVLGHVGDLDEIVTRHAVRTVYLVTPLGGSEVISEVYLKLLDRCIAVNWVPDIFSLRLINHSVREIAGIPVLTLSETPLTGMSLFLKNLEDRVLAALIVLCASPVLLAIAAAIKLDSPGPVFFRQERTGWTGESFRIWKFRSMHVHQPEAGVVKQAQKNDPRLTRVGAFIRRTSLDELPQLFNVLTGEMSLVGPRPHALQHDSLYSQDIVDYFARHNIKPGMTGLAQVRGFRGETKDIEQMIQRVDSDIEYINNWSLWLDFVILVRTLNAFTGKHAY